LTRIVDKTINLVTYFDIILYKIKILCEGGDKMLTFAAVLIIIGLMLVVVTTIVGINKARKADLVSESAIFLFGLIAIGLLIQVIGLLALLDIA